MWICKWHWRLHTILPPSKESHKIKPTALQANILSSQAFVITCIYPITWHHMFTPILLKPFSSYWLLLLLVLDNSPCHSLLIFPRSHTSSVFFPFYDNPVKMMEWKLANAAQHMQARIYLLHFLIFLTRKTYAHINCIWSFMHIFFYFGLRIVNNK